MKLYNFAWGPYPRRVVIYLAEKGIADVELVDVQLATENEKGWPPIVQELNPAGSLPILVADDETVVRQSFAIMEYLEDLHPEPDMLGSTPAERAATRELMTIFDDATSFFGIWATRWGALAEAIGQAISLETSVMGAERFEKNLAAAEAMISDEGPWMTGASVTMADCVAMAMLQICREFYAVSVPSEFPKLAAWYERFAARPSVTELQDLPAELVELGRGLQEQTEFTLGRTVAV